MALIACPECQQSVSDRAATCPRCGVAIAGAVARPIAAPAGLAGVASGAATERVEWEGTPSARLLLSELPALFGAVLALPVSLALMPRAFKVIAGFDPDLRTVIHQQGATLRAVILCLVGAVALYRLARAGLHYAQLKATHYRVTNQRLTIESGLVGKRVDDIDLRTVEDVGLEQSALERLLGVGRLTIVSTDRQRPRLQLFGVADPREVRERVRAGVYAASQRQLYTRAT